MGNVNQSDGRDRQIETLRGRLSRLSDASLRINESLDLDDVLQGVLDSARILAGTRYGVITTLDDQGRMEELRVSGLTVEDARRIWDIPDGQQLYQLRPELTVMKEKTALCFTPTLSIAR